MTNWVSVGEVLKNHPLRKKADQYKPHWCSRAFPPVDEDGHQDWDKYFQSKFGEKLVIWDITQE